MPRPHRRFPLHSAHIARTDARGIVFLRLYENSKRAIPAPVVFEITNPEELRTLIWGLAKALAQMTTITEKED